MSCLSGSSRRTAVVPWLVLIAGCQLSVRSPDRVDANSDSVPLMEESKVGAEAGPVDISSLSADTDSMDAGGASTDRPRRAITVRDDLIFDGIVPTTPPPRDPAVAVRRHTDGGCVLTRSGAVWCWGGRRPRFDGLPVTGVPTRVEGLPAIRSFAGEGPWSGIDANGNFWAWGAVPGGVYLTCAGRVAFPVQTTRVDYPERMRWTNGWLWITEGGALRRSHPEWTNSLCVEHPTYWAGGVTSASSDPFGSLYCVTTERGTVECIGSENDFESRRRIRRLFQTRPIGGTATALEGISDAVHVDLELEYQCVLLRSGRVRCWGLVGHSFSQPESCDFPWEPSSGGEALCRRTPTEVPGIDDAVMIDTEMEQSCALRRNGEVWCWGMDNGTLGLDGSSRDPSRPPYCGSCTRRPERVVGLRDAIDFSISPNVPTGWCAVVRDGRVYCRGECVGDGTCDPHDRPVEVRWGP